MAIKILFPLLNRKSNLNVKNKLLLYKVVIRPIFMYGCPAYRDIAATNIKRLQILQNKTLKLIFDKPWYERTDDIHEEADVLKIKEYLDHLNFRFDQRQLFDPVI